MMDSLRKAVLLLIGRRGGCCVGNQGRAKGGQFWFRGGSPSRRIIYDWVMQNTPPSELGKFELAPYLSSIYS
jgi:hypothetical protein